MLNWNNLSNCTVLVIDDEPDNVDVMLTALRFFGMTVQATPSGNAGLEALRSMTPDLILLDLSMKNMDGWETRAHIKADPKTQHIPIVALTAHAMAGDKERALQAGFDGYLAKPISVRTLLKDLRTTLEENAVVADADETKAVRS